ncbi:unnamed protein product, partial [Rotaria sp. Silwood2]
LEYDYVTEKLWQPLAAGSVPLYLGAPNIDEWLPCYNYSSNFFGSIIAKDSFQDGFPHLPRTSTLT